MATGRGIGTGTGTGVPCAGARVAATAAGIVGVAAVGAGVRIGGREVIMAAKVSSSGTTGTAATYTNAQWHSA
jgi:hypothetical protein